MAQFQCVEESDGFHVYWKSWGIGYVFESRVLAEFATRSLNDFVKLDKQVRDRQEKQVA